MTKPVARMVLRAGAATDTGRLRSVNQDAFVMLPDLGLYAVADGMGGAQGGEIAARLAVEALKDGYLEPSAEALTDVIASANRRIHEAAEDPHLRGMGTTTVALAIVPEEPDPDAPALTDDAPLHLLVANVGDSRAYLFRDNDLTQITDDHSVVAELVRDGRLTEEEADAHPQRNIITRVLGVYPEVTADLWPVDPVRGDRYLLCSDGLFNEVSDNEITGVLRRLSDPSEAAAELVRLANEAGGRDNITAVVVDVTDDGGVAEAASAALAGPGSAASRPAAEDAAGFSTAVAPPAEGKPSRAERRAARKAARKERSRLSWRVVAFVVLLLAVLGGAFATIQWYGTSTYFVGFHGDEVAIYQGRPGGLLWIDPELEADTAIARDEVPALYLKALEAGHEHSSLADAERYVANIERDIIAQDRTATTTSTTTTTTSPTTTTPVAAN